MPSSPTDMERSTAGCKSICVPAPSEVEYQAWVQQGRTFRTYLDALIEKYPEIFPIAIDAGYWLHGSVRSKKLDLTTRRIKLTATGAVYQVRPDFALPYMAGKTDEVEKGLYLRRFGVPFDALAYVFGRDASYWYRLHQSLGRLSIVGTTVRDAADLPTHLIADEKHSWRLGKRVYLSTTVAAGCILGVDVVESADTPALIEGYARFRAEVIAVDPEYRPDTVNTDGWEHTQAAWQTLFPSITIVLCFLHTVLDLQQRCRRTKALWQTLTGRLWHVYHAKTKRQFAQRLRRLRDWAAAHVQQKTVRQKLLHLRTKSPQFQVAYDFPEAYRTSNALDRLMHHQNRLLTQMQYFHGTLDSARLHVRAIALIWNFHPYGSRTQAEHPQRTSPFEDLNGFRYHDNWLHNLLIAGSMNGG